MPLSNLADFDLLHLLLMLSQGNKTGVLQIQRDDERFAYWLQKGRVRSITLQVGRGKVIEGVAALISLLQDPRGHFRFDEGLRCPKPILDSPLEPLAYQALANLPELPLPFESAARIPELERLELFNWDAEEARILDRIRAGEPLSNLASDPHAVQLAARLAKLGILRRRTLRTARLLVTVTFDVAGAVLVDDMILGRWEYDLVRRPEYVGVRDDGGKSYRFPVQGRVGVGALLGVPPDVLAKTSLRGGNTVLVKPL